MPLAVPYFWDAVTVAGNQGGKLKAKCAHILQYTFHQNIVGFIRFCILMFYLTTLHFEFYKFMYFKIRNSQYI